MVEEVVEPGKRACPPLAMSAVEPVSRAERSTPALPPRRCRGGSAGESTLVNPGSPALERSGFNFQILLLPPGLCKGMPWSKDCWACAKRTLFTEQPMPLCPTSAGSNLRLLTAGKKGKPFSQTFSHPSLRADETHGGAQAVRLITQEASRAERRRFESGHPLISSGLRIAEGQAYGRSAIGWQKASRNQAMTGNTREWQRHSHRASLATAPLIRQAFTCAG